MQEVHQHVPFYITSKTVREQHNSNLQTQKTSVKEKEKHLYLFVMGNELGLHMARHKIHSPQNLPSLQSPDGTSRVNA
jgi:hypothetical protein